MKRTEKPALELADGFRSIPERIIDFQSTYQLMIDRDQSDINEDMRVLNEQIETLKSKIKDYEEEAWNTMQARLLSEDDAVPIGFDALVAIETLVGPGHREPLIPKYLRGVKTTAIMIRTHTKMFHADSELRQKQAKLETLKAGAEDLQHWIQGYVKITEARTGVTCDKIKAIALVWGAVRTDAQTLHESMANPVKSHVSEQRFQTLVLETLGIVPLYEKLEGILQGYANTVV
ncbi:hypothetical protein RSOL_143910, partial [Rhizoctonia solani AG-3 Rhs1AP]